MMTGKLLALALMVLTLAGCSTHAMRSQPLWGKEKESEVERPIDIAFEGTNAWPIYYQRGDEMAVLWPLYASTDNGHAVALAYEYQREQNTLRVLQLFPWLPSYARFQYDKKASYVFPYFTWLQKPLKEGEQPKPRRRSGERAYFLFPVYYNSPHTFWTPLYSNQRFLDSHWVRDVETGTGDVQRGDARRVGTLGPLFFHQSSEIDGHNKLYAPYPFVGAWWKGRSTGFQIVPLIYSKREPNGDRYFNLLALLFHTQKELTGHKEQNGQRFGFLTWPLIYWGTDAINENELIERRRREALTTSWPEEIGPDAQPRTKAINDVETTWYRVALFGIFQSRRKIEFKGSAEFPVGANEPTTSEFSARGRKTLRLFPLFSSTHWDDGESGFNLLWQLYNGQEKRRASGEMHVKRTVLWRLYRHESLGGRSLTDMFPFISSARDREANRSRWSLAGGLYERRTEEGVRTTKLLWIPMSKKKVGE
jgi:hypothetical protein